MSQKEMRLGGRPGVLQPYVARPRKLDKRLNPTGLQTQIHPIRPKQAIAELRESGRKSQSHLARFQPALLRR